MGAIFGLPVVAAIPSVSAAVLVVGGVPAGDWLDDPALEPLLLDAATGRHDDWPDAAIHESIAFVRQRLG